MLHQPFEPGRRIFRTLKFAPLLFVICTFGAQARPPAPLHFSVSFPAARSTQPLDGRVLLFISDEEKTEPRTQTDQYRANSTRPIFGVDVDALKPDQEVVIHDKVVGWPTRSLRDIPAGDYWVQALFSKYETFHRADGYATTFRLILISSTTRKSPARSEV